MKKPLKITLISLGSLLGLILLTVIIALWIVVTPARLTAIVRNQAPNFITCDFDIERADLTLFKTFPKVGLEIDDVVLVNPMEGSPSDTLAYINECVVAVDVMKFLKEDKIIINECMLNGGYINLYTDSQGNANIDIFPPSEPDTDTIEESSEFTYVIDLTSLRLNDVTVNYADLTQGMVAELKGMNVLAKGNMKGEDIAGDVNMSVGDVAYQQKTDSLMLAVKLNDLKMEGDAMMCGDDINADINVSSSYFLYECEGDVAEFNALDLKYKGDFNAYDVVKGDAELTISDLSYSMNNDTLVNKADIKFVAPVNATLSTMDVELGASQLSVNNIILYLVGKVSMPEDDINVDLNVSTNTLIVEELIGLIPASMREELLAGIDAKGEVKLAVDIEGVYNETSMPVVNAELEYNKGTVSMPEMLPYPITNINTSLKADIDLNDKSDVYIDYLNADMSKTSLSLSGTIKDVMDKMYCDVNLEADACLDELKPFVPEDIVAEGNVKLNVDAKVNNYQLSTMNFKKAKVKGNLQWNDMNVVYCDTIDVNSDRLELELVLPNPEKDLANSLAMVKISGTNMDAKVSDMIVANLKDYNIDAQVSDIFDENVPMSVYADYKFSRIDATMDDMNLFANNPEGNVAMYTKDNGVDASYVAVYKGDSLSFDMGDEMSFVTEILDFNVSADYDDDQEDLLLQWNPHAGIRLNKAVFAMSDIPTPVYIPSIDFQYDSTGIEIKNSSVMLGDSDFELQGKFTNVDEFIRKEALLKGELDFTSHYTDVNQLMELFSGAGDTTVIVEEEVVVMDTIEKEDEPFMVPLGVDITLNTKIENAVAGQMSLSNLGGGLTVKDGVMVLREMGFTTDAATMEVTAMYKSSRKNHLYLGLDLHLLEIDIAEMIDLIPELDTLVPMLSSFAGRAEFHFAAETYLKSNYDLKMSTLKGVLAIHGNDLVILDNETYKKIGKLLGFKNKEHNKIDKLAVEMTAFKNEIDVYPTLIAVDKYQAIVAGRHNLDMTFDYRLGISNPWPFRRLGIKIGGDLDNMKYKLVGKRNIDLEDPKGKKEDVHLIQETMRLKQLIYDSVK